MHLIMACPLGLYPSRRNLCLLCVALHCLRYRHDLIFCASAILRLPQDTRAHRCLPQPPPRPWFHLCLQLWLLHQPVATPQDLLEVPGEKWQKYLLSWRCGHAPPPPHLLCLTIYIRPGPRLLCAQIDRHHICVRKAFATERWCREVPAYLPCPPLLLHDSRTHIFRGPSLTHTPFLTRLTDFSPLEARG